LYTNQRKNVNFRFGRFEGEGGRHLKEPAMTSPRRTFLMTAGATVLALAGAGGLFAVTRRPTSALRPWDDVVAWEHAGAISGDTRLDIFRYAILAPNPHNRQPWQIRLVGTDEALIQCDLDRRLPQTDPFDRQITMGFGCFLELARIAAAQRGFRMDADLFPKGEPAPRLTRDPIAHVRFIADAAVARDPLFSAIPARRTSKVPFDMTRALSHRELATITPMGTLGGGPGPSTFTTSDPALVADLRALTWRAWMIEAATARTWKESVDLMRIGRAEIEANPDGIALSGVAIEALALAGQISRPALADPLSGAYKAGIDRYRPMLEATPAYLWVTTPGNSRADQIAAGRVYVRANLQAALAGLSLHPVSQALQEFPEMETELGNLHRRLDVAAPNRIQMLARLGHAAPVDATVRWRLETKMRAS
jgi:hypothetical protein